MFVLDPVFEKAAEAGASFCSMTERDADGGDVPRPPHTSALWDVWTPGSSEGSCSHEITVISGMGFVRGCILTCSLWPVQPEYHLVALSAVHRLAVITQLYCLSENLPVWHGLISDGKPRPTASLVLDPS